MLMPDYAAVFCRHFLSADEPLPRLMPPLFSLPPSPCCADYATLDADAATLPPLYMFDALHTLMPPRRHAEFFT